MVAGVDVFVERALACASTTTPADISGNVHLVLSNNLWGTAFPRWFDLDMRFRVKLGFAGRSTSNGDGRQPRCAEGVSGNHVHTDSECTQCCGALIAKEAEHARCI